MATDTDPSGIEQRAVLRALAGATGIGLLVALATTWTHPPFNDRALSGWALLASGFGDTEAQVCGTKTCKGTDNLVVGTAPTLAALLLAACLVATCLTVTRARCRLALVLGALTLLGVLGEAVTMGSAVSRLNGGEHHPVGAGLLITAILAVIGMTVAGSLSSHTTRRASVLDHLS